MSSSTTYTLPDGRKLSYALSSSPADGRIVVLANSLAAPFDVWDHVVGFLEGIGFRTLRLNQPGHGDSDAPNPPTKNTFQSMANDVHILLVHLGLKQVYAWIGVSMGAAMGVVFVTSYLNAVQRLIICDTISCSPVNAGTEDLFGARVALAKKEGMKSIVAGTMERWFGRDWMDANPKEAARVQDIMMSTKVDGFEACCSALSSDTFDLRPLFAKVPTSVEKSYLIVGEKDADLPQEMEKMRAEIEVAAQKASKQEKVELTIIPNAGHVCFVDNFDVFCKTVKEYLA